MEIRLVGCVYGVVGVVQWNDCQAIRARTDGHEIFVTVDEAWLYFSRGQAASPYIDILK